MKFLLAATVAHRIRYTLGLSKCFGMSVRQFGTVVPSWGLLVTWRPGRAFLVNRGIQPQGISVSWVLDYCGKPTSMAGRT